MNQKRTSAYRLETPSLTSLKLLLKEAKLVSPPDVLEPQKDADEQLALALIDNMKKRYTKPSLFANWMGRPLPNEYREMVAADVR